MIEPWQKRLNAYVLRTRAVSFVEEAMQEEIDELRAELDKRDRKIGNAGTSCGEYVECSGRPDAPHGVDLDASFRAGRTVCVCKSWAPGEAS